MGVLKKFVPFLIFAVLLFAACGNTNKPDEPAPTSKANTQDLQQAQSNKNLDLGMTFEQFRLEYENNAQANELTPFSLKDVTTTNNGESFDCIFPYVVMRVEVNTNNGNIRKISVVAEPFKSSNREERTNTLIAQSNVFSLAVSVFAPEMNQQDYRENMLKRFYSNPDVNYLLNDKVRCQSVKKDDTLALQAKAKDLED